jgi:hypothetical protein
MLSCMAHADLPLTLPCAGEAAAEAEAAGGGEEEETPVAKPVRRTKKLIMTEVQGEARMGA